MKKHCHRPNASLTATIVLLALFTISHPARGGVVRIPGEASDFDQAIALAQNGDTILVAPGVYSGSGNANIHFSGKSLVVAGVAGAHSTELLLENDSHDGFVLTDAEADGILVTGITIRGGRYGIAAWDCYPKLEAVTITESRVGVKFLRGYSADSSRSIRLMDVRFEACDTGVAVISVSDAPGRIAEIDACAFVSNGRGLFYYSGESGPERWVTVQASHFSLNQYAVYSTDFLFPEEMQIDNCTFAENTTAVVNSVTLKNCSITGGTTGLRGYLSSRIVVDSSSFTAIDGVVLKSNVWQRYQSGSSHWWLDPGFYLTACTIENNPGTIASLGGFIDEDPVGASFRNCTMRDNGGGIAVEQGVHTLLIENSLYSGNDAGLDIQAIGSEGLTVRNSTFANNSGPAIRTGTYRWQVDITGTLLFGNDTGIHVTYLAPNTVPHFNCNNVYGNLTNFAGVSDPTGTDDNVSADPLFCSLSENEFSVFESSPCLVSPCGQIGYGSAGCALPAVSWLWVDSVEENLCVDDSLPIISWSPVSVLAGGQISFELEVGTDTDWSIAELWSTGTIVSDSMSARYAGLPLVPGDPYHVRVRTQSPFGWSEWYPGEFRLNRAPLAPQLVTGDSSQFSTSVPALLFLAGFDPDGDSLDYHVECATTAVFDTLLEVSGTATLTDTVHEWVPSASFAENSATWWRVRSVDMCVTGEPGVARMFWTNSVNESPSAPSLVSPASHAVSTLYDLTPSLSWTPSTDVDPFDSVFYRVEVSADSFFTVLSALDSLSATNATVPPLSSGTRYWWRVHARDREGLFGPVSETGSFRTWTPGDLNGSNTLTVADVTRLVSYLFLTGTPIDPPHIGDFSGDCETSIADLVLLVSYIFNDGLPLVAGCSQP